RSKTLRFTDIVSNQQSRYNSEAPYSPSDPFTAYDKTRANKLSGNISKATEKVFDKEREAIAEREQIAEEYSRALDDATGFVQKLGLGHAIGQLEKALAQVLKRFAHGEDLLDSEIGLSGANLPPKPSNSLPSHISHTRKIDNRIFVRLPEAHPSRDHHAHAVKAALNKQLELGNDTLKTVQK
ncbi:putative virulence effector, partial [Golovinomyces cichoracearum]